MIGYLKKRFKYHLDRYKYANRYSEVNSLDHRNECENILINVENFISSNEWFFGNDINKFGFINFQVLRIRN